MASRWLGPAGFGEYTVLMAVMLSFGRPLEALSPFVARTLIEYPARSLRDLLPIALISGLALGAVQLIFLVFWRTPLTLPQIILFLLAASTLPAWSLLYAYRGLLQAKKRDALYLLSRPVELTVRLLASGVFFALGGRVISAITAGLIGIIASIGQINFSVRPGYFLSFKVDRKLFLDYLKIMLITLAGGFFIGLDMIIAGKVFSPEDCGRYALISLIGKGVLIYAFLIFPLLYPRLVEHRISKKGLYYLGVGYLFSAAVFGAAFIIFFFWGGMLIPFFFGEVYRKSADYLPAYLLAVFPLCLNYGVVNLKAAFGGWSECIFLWAALALYSILLLTSPPVFYDYFLRMGIFQLIAAAAGFWFLARRS